MSDAMRPKSGSKADAATTPITATGSEPEPTATDRALSAWPLRETTPAEDDRRAEAIAKALARGDRGQTARLISDGDLFHPPTGAGEEPVTLSGAAADSSGEDPDGNAGAEAKMGLSRQSVTVTAGNSKTSRNLRAHQISIPPRPSTVGPFSGIPTSPKSLIGAFGPSSPSMADAAGAASGDDSGLIDLKAMSAAEEGAKAPVAQDTVKTLPPGPMSAPAAEAAMAAALAPASATLPDMTPARETPVPETKASPSHAPAAVAAFAPSKVAVADAPAKAESAKKGAPLALLLGGGAALVAIAAGAFVMLRPSSEPKVDAPVAIAAKPVEAPAAKAVEAPAPKIETPAPEPAPVAVDDSLAAKSPVAAKPQAAIVANAGAPKAVAAAPAAAPKAEPKAAPEHVDPKLVVKDAPPTSASAGALSDAMRQAAGPSNDQPQAAGGSADPGAAPGSVPQRPSQGAVTGALGAVLPSARACLGPDDPVSKASITFGSSGSVQSVIISGFVAGKPAEACVREALMKAKVPAFAQPTFPANVTIRP